MALKKTVTLTNNFGGQSTFENAYIKVAVVRATKENGVAIVNYSKTSGDASFYEESHEFPVSLLSGNFIAQAYGHLKTLPEFSGAEDC